MSLMMAAFFLLVFFGAVKLKARRPILYLIPAIGAWSCVMFSGIHATVAGVLIALLVPVRPKIDSKSFLDDITHALHTLDISGFNRGDSRNATKEQWQLVEKIYLTADDMIPPGLFLEKHLHPIQAFVILPLFALFSAGVTINNAIMTSLLGNISLGIICGLFFGKQLGILALTWLAKVLGLAELPSGVRWSHIWGVSILAGIGFTMSIFISELGFSDPLLIDEAKIAIFIASLLSGIIGFLVLKYSLRHNEEPL